MLEEEFPSSGFSQVPIYVACLCKIASLKVAARIQQVCHSSSSVESNFLSEQQQLCSMVPSSALWLSLMLLSAISI